MNVAPSMMSTMSTSPTSPSQPPATSPSEPIVVFLQSNDPRDPRIRYTAQKHSSLWPFIWQYLCTTGRISSLATPLCVLDIEVAGKRGYRHVMADLMNQKPSISLEKIGVEHGGLIKISSLGTGKGRPKWAEHTVEFKGPVVILEKKADALPTPAAKGVMTPEKDTSQQETTLDDTLGNETTNMTTPQSLLTLSTSPTDPTEPEISPTVQKKRRRFPFLVDRTTYHKTKLRRVIDASQEVPDPFPTAQARFKERISISQLLREVSPVPVTSPTDAPPTPVTRIAIPLNPNPSSSSTDPQRPLTNPEEKEVFEVTLKYRQPAKQLEVTLKYGPPKSTESTIQATLPNATTIHADQPALKETHTESVVEDSTYDPEALEETHPVSTVDDSSYDPEALEPLFSGPDPHKVTTEETTVEESTSTKDPHNSAGSGALPRLLPLSKPLFGRWRETTAWPDANVAKAPDTPVLQTMMREATSSPAVGTQLTATSTVILETPVHEVEREPTPIQAWVKKSVVQVPVPGTQEKSLEPNTKPVTPSEPEASSSMDKELAESREPVETVMEKESGPEIPIMENSVPQTELTAVTAVLLAPIPEKVTTLANDKLGEDTREGVEEESHLSPEPTTEPETEVQTEAASSATSSTEEKKDIPEGEVDTSERGEISEQSVTAGPAETPEAEAVDKQLTPTSETLMAVEVEKPVETESHDEPPKEIFAREPSDDLVTEELPRDATSAAEPESSLPVPDQSRTTVTPDVQPDPQPRPQRSTRRNPGQPLFFVSEDEKQKMHASVRELVEWQEWQYSMTEKHVHVSQVTIDGILEVPWKSLERSDKKRTRDVSKRRIKGGTNAQSRLPTEPNKRNLNDHPDLVWTPIDLSETVAGKLGLFERDTTDLIEMKTKSTSSSPLSAGDSKIKWNVVKDSTSPRPFMNEADVVIEISDDSDEEDRDNKGSTELKGETYLTTETEGNNTNNDIKSHWLRKTSKGWYLCDFKGCGYGFKNWLRDGIRHFDNVHGACGGYCCPHPGCEGYFPNVAFYEKHTLDLHNGVRLSRMELSEDEIARRKLLMTGDSKTCPLCVKKTFKDPLELVKHMDDHHSDKGFMWKCPLCFEKKMFFFNPELLEEHLRSGTEHKKLSRRRDLSIALRRAPKLPAFRRECYE